MVDLALVYLVADFYEEMQATATEMLTEFNQGAIVFTPMVAGANEWDAKTLGTPIPLSATVMGAESKYWNDLITQSDLKVTSAVFSSVPTMDGLITIDGNQKQIIRIDPLPAAGTTVAWQIFVKG